MYEETRKETDIVETPSTIHNQTLHAEWSITVFYLYFPYSIFRLHLASWQYHKHPSSVECVVCLFATKHHEIGLWPAHDAHDLLLGFAQGNPLHHVPLTDVTLC